MEAVFNGVAKLPPKCKQVFLLSKKEGLSNVEIADYLNLSLKTVEGHITKAYRLIKESVQTKWNQLLFILLIPKFKKVKSFHDRML